MVMKYGLEKEYFVYKNPDTDVSTEDKDGVLVPCPDWLPQDGGGILAEARGRPASNIREAVFSLLAEEYRMQKEAEKRGYVLVETPVQKIPRHIRNKVRRTHTKDIRKYRNLYGYEEHRGTMTEQLAGVHVSFCDEYRGEKAPVNQNFDWFRLFKRLDQEFKEEIKNTKRRPGFYEFKIDRRIEYRSLPSNVNLFELIDVIERLNKERW